MSPLRSFMWMPDCELWNDGDPKFTSQEFQEFLTSWNVRHIVTSLLHPQSNGLPSRPSNTSLGKRLSGNIHCEVFNRTTGAEEHTKLHRISPAQILSGHPLHTCVTVHLFLFQSGSQVRKSLTVVNNSKTTQCSPIHQSYLAVAYLTIQPTTSHPRLPSQ